MKEVELNLLLSQPGRTTGWWKWLGFREAAIMFMEDIKLQPSMLLLA